MSSILKDILNVGLSNVLIILFGLITSMITARWLGPEKNGIISALLVYPSLFMTIGSLGIRQSTTYYLGKNIYTEEQIKTAISQIWFFTSIISIVSCFLLIFLFNNKEYKLIWILLTLLPIPFSLFNTYNSGIFLGKNDIQTFNRINWVPSLLTLIGSILFIIYLKYDITGYLFSAILGPFFMSLVLLFKNQFIKAFKLNFNWNIIYSMLKLGIVYAISLLIINLNYRIDIILLDNLSTPFELGIYSKGASISQYLWQIPMLLSTIIFARSAIAKNDHTFSLKVAQLLRISLLIVGLISILLIVLSKYIIFILYGSKFYNSTIVLQLLLPGVIILTAFKVMNMDLAGKGKPWISMKAMIPALIINILSNIILIPELGSKGAAISSTLSYSIAGILFIYFYSKETKISIRVIFDYKISDFNPILSIINKKFTKAKK